MSSPSATTISLSGGVVGVMGELTALVLVDERGFLAGVGGEVGVLVSELLRLLFSDILSLLLNFVCCGLFLVNSFALAFPLSSDEVLCLSDACDL